MDSEELTILAEEIAKRARPWMILQMIVSWLFVIPGLCVIANNRDATAYNSWYYLYHRKILRNNVDNKKYFPQENLLEDKYQAGYIRYCD